MVRSIRPRTGSMGSRRIHFPVLAVSFQWIWFRLSPGRYSRSSWFSAKPPPGLGVQRLGLISRIDGMTAGAWGLGRMIMVLGDTFLTRKENNPK